MVMKTNYQNSKTALNRTTFDTSLQLMIKIIGGGGIVGIKLERGVIGKMLKTQ